MSTNALRIHPSDTVAVALRALQKGEAILGVTLEQDIPQGHKFALRNVRAGEDIIKYGAVIGRATQDIPQGGHVHSHNLSTALSGALEYRYAPCFSAPAEAFSGQWMGYARSDGRVGTRNEIWILPTVGCVNKAAERIAQAARDTLGAPVFAYTHPYGCSQLGQDHQNTQKLLAALCRHPNAGGALVLGLGCENNHIAAFQKVLGEVDQARVKFLAAQDVPDEIEAGLALTAQIWETVRNDKRTAQPLSKLVIGLKCGGSDGLSGITANPLLGAVSDGVCACGGRALLTEVPEMFGAETLLMARCRNEQTFDDTVSLINGFKAYYARYNQPCYENPSPGNKAGGITTLEEKSLGCTQKGGLSAVCDVLSYAQPAKRDGLSLVFGPGNDICAVTALTAAGAQEILFTTGRGTPLGAPVPTIKVSTHTELFESKPNWIDFDAGALLRGQTMPQAAQSLLALMLEVANGEETQNEKHGFREIAIFKDGVTL